MGSKVKSIYFADMNQEEILRILLPEGILNFFTVTQIENTPALYKIFLEEKNIPPENIEGKLVSKGFCEPISIQDFPLRGKACFLKVKRRRWTNLDTGEIVSRDWDLVANGTRMTSEFAAFLKAINR